MALPTNSVAPDAPADSTAIDGILGLGNAEQEIRAWLAKLSPDGATAYEASATVTIADSAVIDLYASGQPINVSRLGKWVELEGVAKAIQAGSITGATGVLIGTIPAGYRPARTRFVVCQGSGTERWLLEISQTGELKASRYSGTQPAGAWLPISAVYRVA